MEFASEIRLGSRTIGPGQPVFLIAEIGVNHNGDMDLARRTVDAAARAGADAVKFQSFRAEEFMADRELQYAYEHQGRSVRESMYAMFKRLEFPLDQHRAMFEYARSQGVEPLTSVADPICLEAALAAGAQALKLASEDFINLPLLRVAARAGVPLILSTGMADEGELQDVMDVLEDAGCQDVAMLHCVSLYPTPDGEVRLTRMQRLRELSRAMVGYSDHSLGTEACLGAVAMGAVVLEKHFTLDRNLPGPDHAMSADPEEFADLVRSVRRMEMMLGDSGFAPGPMEQDIRREFRRSVVAARDLSAGTVLDAACLACKRPGTGLRPRALEGLFGKRLNRDLARDEQIAWEMIKDMPDD